MWFGASGRRLNGTASVLASVVNNAPVTLTHVPTSRTRHPPQPPAPAASPAPTRRRDTSRVQLTEEADGDDDTEEGGKGDEEDNAPYCYCNQPSHGEVRPTQVFAFGVLLITGFHR